MFKLKKAISKVCFVALLLQCVIIANFSPVSVKAATITSIPFTENFNSYTAGNLPSTWAQQPGTGIFKVISDDMGGTDPNNKVCQGQAAKTGSSADSPYMEDAFSNVFTGKTTIEAKIKTDTMEANKDLEIMLKDGGGRFMTIAKMINGNIQAANGGSSGASTVRSYEVNKWYTVRVCLDSNSTNYRIYITDPNGVTTYSNRSLINNFGSSGTFSLIYTRIQVYNNGNATPVYGWVDDFKVYRTPDGITADPPVFQQVYGAGQVAGITELVPGVIRSEVKGDNSTGESKPVAVVLALYEGEVLKDITCTMKNIDYMDKSVDAELNVAEVKDNYSMVAFAWNTLKGMQPLSSYKILMPPNKAGTGDSDLVTAGTVSPATISVNGSFANNIVTVTGAISSGANKKVTMLAIKPDYSFDNLDPNNIKDSVSYIKQQTVTDNQGQYVFTFTLQDSFKGGVYTVVVGGEAVEEPQKYSFEFINSEKRQIAMDAINYVGSGTKVLENVIFNNEYKKSFDMIGLWYDDFNTLQNKQTVCDEVYSNRLYQGAQGEVKLKTVFNNAVAVENINEAEQSDMGSKLLRYNSVFGLQLASDSLYGRLVSRNEAWRVYEKLYNKNFTSIGDVQEQFNEAVVIVAIITSNYGELEDVIEDNNDVLHLDLNGDYAGLSDLDKAAVLKKIVGKETLSEIQTAFTAAVNEVVNQVKKSQSSKPSGGGGGGKLTTITVLPVVPDLNAIPAQNTTRVFKDIDDVSWAKESIEFLAGNKIIEGFEDDTFRPADRITREQYVKMIVQAFHVSDIDAEANFSDIQEDAWYKPYIAAAKKSGIVNGLPDGTFGVGKEITRQEMAVIAYRAATAANIQLVGNDTETDFADIREIDDYAKSSVTVMQKAGIIQGDENNMFQPAGFSTRAQAAKVIYGLLKFIK